MKASNFTDAKKGIVASSAVNWKVALSALLGGEAEQAFDESDLTTGSGRAMFDVTFANRSDRFDAVKRRFGRVQ